MSVIASGGEVIAGSTAGLALAISLYGAVLATRTHRWQQSLEQERLSTKVSVTASEHSSLGDGPLIIGETIAREHLLTVRVLNGGESPEYVRTIELESEREQALTVWVRSAHGTVEVRPRDETSFGFELTGAQGFPWDERMRLVVTLANRHEVTSDYFEMHYAPCHGQPMTVQDPNSPDAVVAVRINPNEGRIVKPE